MIRNRASSRRPESVSIHVENENEYELGSNFNRKAITLKRLFLFVNFILKLVTVFFGQLSSPEHPVYGLLNMVISYITFIISIILLVCKRRQGRVELRWRCLLRKPDIEFICDIVECVITSIAYFIFLSRHVDDPIRINLWPTLFACVRLYSATANPSQRQPSDSPEIRQPIPQNTESILLEPPSNESIPPPPLSTVSIQPPQNTQSTALSTQSVPQNRGTTFTVAELKAATNDFSPNNKIGEGSVGVVYRGKLDGREVAIKRGNIGGANSSWFQEDENGNSSWFQEDENGFISKLAVLSRICHENLVGLVGYCVDSSERLLVYEYMNNSSLSFHLHENISSSEFNIWKIRIKIALDIARGIEYLHKYAEAPIIHGDLRSSNILLDLNWKARVSDFGLSLMDPDSQISHGFIGYDSDVLTTDTDVYSFGVVLLELLTGKEAMFYDFERGKSRELVYFINNIIKFHNVLDARVARQELDGTVALNDEAWDKVLHEVLDRRVGRPVLDDKDAVKLVFKTALRCVTSKGRDMPTMTDIVANWDRALSNYISMPRFPEIIH